MVATTREVLDRPELHEGLLEEWELRRLAPARLPERRADAVAARLLVRLCAARFTGLPVDGAAPAQWCPDCERHGHGRPYLPGRPGVGVSLSHADGVVAAAVGPGPLGVDVEPAARRPGPLRVLRRLLPEAELREAAALPDPGPALLRLWVRGEALFKAGAAGGPAGGVRGAPGSGPVRHAGEGPADGRPVGEGPGGEGPVRGESAGGGAVGGDPSGLRLLEWTDGPRGAVVAVASTVPVLVLPGLAPSEAPSAGFRPPGTPPAGRGRRPCGPPG